LYINQLTLPVRDSSFKLWTVFLKLIVIVDVFIVARSVEWNSLCRWPNCWSLSEEQHDNQTLKNQQFVAGPRDCLPFDLGLISGVQTKPHNKLAQAVFFLISRAGTSTNDTGTLRHRVEHAQWSYWLTSAESRQRKCAWL
jgi:hypothetical protein